MKQFAFILIITFLSLGGVHAQKIRNASGMAQFRLEEDMSKDELKDKLRHHRPRRRHTRPALPHKCANYQIRCAFNY